MHNVGTDQLPGGFVQISIPEMLICARYLRDALICDVKQLPSRPLPYSLPDSRYAGPARRGAGVVERARLEIA